MRRGSMAILSISLVRRLTSAGEHARQEQTWKNAQTQACCISDLLDARRRSARLARTAKPRFGV